MRLVAGILSVLICSQAHACRFSDAGYLVTGAAHPALPMGHGNSDTRSPGR